jgi:hypothetical protein
MTATTFVQSPINIDALQTALEEGVLNSVPELKEVIEAYEVLESETLKELNMPCLSIELNEFDKTEEQSGTGQVRMDVTIEARVWMRAERKAGIKCRDVALKVAQALRLQQFDQPITPIDVMQVSAEPYANNDGLRTHCMMVQASTTLTLGRDAWEDVEFEGYDTRTVSQPSVYGHAQRYGGIE